MITVYFLYGLAFFSMGLAVWLEAGQSSKLPLGRQLPWLAAFGLLHSLVEWADMLRLVNPGGPAENILLYCHMIFLPLSAVLLVRFGIGLINDAGPLPGWLTLLPLVLLVPAGLLISYGLIISMTHPLLYTAVDVWSRYLLYLPGSLLSAFGFIRQGRRLEEAKLYPGRRALMGAGLAFMVNALVAGLVVPPASYGLAPWINTIEVQSLTGVPVQIWRALSAVAITLLVIRALGVFEAERKQELEDLNEAHEKAQRAALEAQSAAREKAEGWIKALVGISKRIANMEQVDLVLLAVVEMARRLLGSDVAGLGLWDETGNRLEVKCFATQEGSQPSALEWVENSLILDAIRNAIPRCYTDGTSSGSASNLWVCPILHREIHAAAVVPLQLEDRSIGGLWVSRLESQPYTTDDLLGLERLAAQAVIAITHAILAAREQSLAVIEERGRIAREMHDGLAQILGYLSLEMQTLEALITQGDQDKALAELKQARQRIHAAQADVRENILSLRTTLAGEAGITAALQEYIDEFSVQTGLNARFLCEMNQTLTLSPLAETQMVRIVQEALANVRKHAQASQVLVRLAQSNGCLRVSITDDGIGFDHSVKRCHFGLSTMRERAASVGGGLTVTSQTGEGTQVELWLPLVQN